MDCWRSQVFPLRVCFLCTGSSEDVEAQVGNGAVCMEDIAAPRRMPALRLGEETSRRVNKIFLRLSLDERCLRSTLPRLRFCCQLGSVPFFRIARFVYCSNTFSPEQLA